MTMHLTKLRSKAQLTLPKEVVTTLRLVEGDLLTVEVEDGKIVLEPQTVIPKDEAWLFTPEAQASLKRGLKDFEEGKLHGPFTTPEDLSSSLDS